MADSGLTHAQFARKAARVASKAASWAADCLDLDSERPMRSESVERFLSEIRMHLDHIEHLHAAAKSDTPS